jgi:hypothetical protein
MRNWGSFVEYNTKGVKIIKKWNQIWTLIISGTTYYW